MARATSLAEYAQIAPSALVCVSCVDANCDNSGDVAHQTTNAQYQMARRHPLQIDYGVIVAVILWITTCFDNGGRPSDESATSFDTEMGPSIEQLYDLRSE